MSIQELFHRMWMEYCSGSSVFAMRYLTKDHVTYGERFWWICWICCTLVTCIISVESTFRKWKENPVIISYDSELLPTWDVPFPAVTVCPLDKAKSEYFNLTEAFIRLNHGDILSRSEYENIRALKQVCPLVNQWFEATPTWSENPVRVLRSLAIPMEYQFQACLWRDVQFQCSDLFSRTVTYMGICYTFNGISDDELFRKNSMQEEYNYSNSHLKANWTLENGYTNRFDVYSYPFRPVGAGRRSSLAIALQSNRDDQDYLCNGPLGGYIIFIHPPDEIPTLTTPYYRLPHSSYLSLSVKPELTLISEALKKHPYQRRQCYFSEERTLRYFRIYNRNNCIAECVANRTLALCDCVEFWAPRGLNVTVCDASKQSCYERAVHDLFQSDNNANQPRAAIEGVWQEPCGCLPACTALKYEAEISRVPIQFEPYVRAMGSSYHEYSRIDPALLFVSFKSKWMLPLKRQERIGFSALLASFGGLFALMMGASLISFLELVYYCIIRPCRYEIPVGSREIRQVYPWRP